MLHARVNCVVKTGDGVEIGMLRDGTWGTCVFRVCSGTISTADAGL